MAPSTKSPSSIVLAVLLVLVSVIGCPSSTAHLLKTCMFDAIYQLGDSISDTGNLIRQNPNTPFSHLPYGETLFNKSTGRCSNGLLMIDYFALDAGLPLVNPYLNKDALTRHGVNFAVAGSTALSSQLLSQKQILSPVTNSSLNQQLYWMFSHFNSICYNQRDCNEKLRNALFLVGEIGGNDYNYALFQGKTIQDVKDMVPQVVQTIKNAVEKAISYGATRVVVPGNFPIGCLPIYLTGFQTNDTTAYDELHCLKDLNGLATYHNDQIKEAIEVLKRENPHTMIVYGDYYNALLWILRRAFILGFDETSLQKSCCGIGGDYNFSLMKMCGVGGVSVCSNPDERVSWDGIHLTQNAYKFMAYWLIHDILPQLHCIV
ncbi:acetylajmalan esterase-like [Cucurbita maxima]|uniref:Acetylajmalan esterase-like n=1 Tax=Cucurbita maxima TaxID=3661 RepID=A0A6J1KDZ5_CUCMA|nr:acetylajmalan esterase-like [Cucurbita maxima]XP_022998971.1 acetylajmalan esterase-like [Cucurbita maxima]